MRLYHGILDDSELQPVAAYAGPGDHPRGQQRQASLKNFDITTICRSADDGAAIELVEKEWTVKAVASREFVCC